MSGSGKDVSGVVGISWDGVGAGTFPDTHTGSLGLSFYMAQTAQTPTIPPPLADTVHTVFTLSVWSLTPG